jgi:hypothetical protein
MLTEELSQFIIPAADTITVQTSQLQGFCSLCPRSPQPSTHSAMNKMMFWGQIVGKLPLLGGRKPWRNDSISTLCRFGRKVPQEIGDPLELWDSLRVWESVEMCWLGLHHRPPRTSGLTLTTRWGILGVGDRRRARVYVMQPQTFEANTRNNINWSLTLKYNFEILEQRTFGAYDNE